MSKSGVVHMLLYPSMVLLPAHYQMLRYCGLAKPDSHTKRKLLASQDYSYGMSLWIEM